MVTAVSMQHFASVTPSSSHTTYSRKLHATLVEMHWQIMSVSGAENVTCHPMQTAKAWTGKPLNT